VRPLLRFRLLGVPIHVQPYFLVTAAVFALGMGSPLLMLVAVAMIAAGVLWHELGHALAMRAFGYRPSIELVAMGGLTHFPEGADPTARQDLAISAAGPAAGLLLGGVAWWLSRWGPPLPPTADFALMLAVRINVGWSLFNLLPLIPLDGSHVCDSLTRWVTGRQDPLWVGWASLAIGIAVVLYGLAGHGLWLAFLGGLGAYNGIGRLQRGGGRRGWASTGAAARGRAREARARGDLSGVAAALLPAARVGALPESDLADLVGALVRTGEEGALVALVRDRLRTFGRRRDAGPLAQFAMDGLSMIGAHEEAVEVAELAFQQLDVAQYGYDAAVHLVALDRRDEAVAWLRRAMEAGLDCGMMLLSDPALEPLRGRPDFFDLTAQAGVRPGAA
jgi:Zn-dependent protease